MSFILDGLYIGGIDDAIDTQKLRNISVSHILTLDVKPLPLEYSEGFHYKYIHALDLEDFDLLGDFNDGIKFIEEGRRSGGILVHCFVGQSRSATVIVAYIMQKLDLSLQDALTLVKKQRPEIGPNPGFMKQLSLFEQMGNKLCCSNQLYKQYKLQNLALQIQSAQFVTLPSQSLSADPNVDASPQQVFYKCKKCRRPLFKASAILTHTEGFGEAAFTWQKQCGEREDAPVCDASLFIEPVQWMEQDILQIAGKLSCPKCRAKLGSFQWTGEKCPCGTWVTPAFHIQINKVDKAMNSQQQQLYQQQYKFKMDTSAHTQTLSSENKRQTDEASQNQSLKL